VINKKAAYRAASDPASNFGGVVSTTRTVLVQLDLRPAWSVAVWVTLVAPSGYEADPGGRVRSSSTERTRRTRGAS